MRPVISIRTLLTLLISSIFLFSAFAILPSACSIPQDTINDLSFGEIDEALLDQQESTPQKSENTPPELNANQNNQEESDNIIITYGLEERDNSNESNESTSGPQVECLPPIKTFNASTPIPESTAPAYPDVLSVSPVKNMESHIKCMSFLNDVIHVNFSQYKVMQLSDYMGQPIAGCPTEYLTYSLYCQESRAVATLTINNGMVTSCNLQLTFGPTISFSTPITSGNDAAKNILTGYQLLTGDSNINKMLDLLKNVGLGENSTQILDNISFNKIIKTGYSSFYSFNWRYMYNGVPFSGITFNLKYNGPSCIMLSFIDNRALFKIGHSEINVSKEQAIDIAQNFVGNYSYPVVLGDGTVNVVKNLNITNNPQADLDTTIREPTTLYPYWSVYISFDNAKGVFVDIWADTGEILDVKFDAVESDFVNFLEQTVSFQEIIYAVAIVWVAFVMLAVVFVPLRNKNKQG